jgi:tetratricopeptide (TPR) repeat protein
MNDAALAFRPDPVAKETAAKETAAKETAAKETAVASLQHAPTPYAAADRTVLKAAADRTCAIGEKLVQRGERGDAETLFGVVLTTDPNHFEALVGLGTICTQANRLDEARRHFQHAVAVNDSSAKIHGSLGAVESAAGRLDTAAGHYLKALALAPDHPGILYAYAVLLQRQGKNDQAMAALRRAIANKPQHLDAYFTLGNLLYAAGKDIEAAKCYLAVLNYSPDHAETHNNLGNVLLRQGHPERAVAQYQKAIASKPDYADAHGNCGNALLELNRLEESIAQNLLAIRIKPERFGSYNNLGVAYQALGRFDEATAAFERALALSPDEAPIHLNLANMTKFKPGDKRLPALQSLLDGIDALDQEQEIAAHFAMGKALADLGDHDMAFHHLQAGNALKRTTFAYDEAQRLAAMKHVADTFTPELFATHAGHGDSSEAPIFIVGMPRSGTTLLEQVLASHSQVFGAGELETFKDAIGQCARDQSKLRGAAPAYPELVDALSSEQITGMGRIYTERLRTLAPGAPRVVDKMPLNFLFVGLIHLALPKARIIHIRRDPLDNCVSCFSLLFTGHQPFAYELGELGRYYRGYQDVMAHWRHVLPPDVMIDVDYEALVGDLEKQTRRVLAHCGLAWEDGCRDFQDTKRAVRTASLMQVRQPLYRTSLGSWRRYEKHLGPLRDALDPPAHLRQ